MHIIRTVFSMKSELILSVAFTFAFLCLFDIRQSHQSFFQKSDLFFVCMLQPQSFDIQSQASEIEAAKVYPYMFLGQLKWIPLIFIWVVF